MLGPDPTRKAGWAIVACGGGKAASFFGRVTRHRAAMQSDRAAAVRGFRAAPSARLAIVSLAAALAACSTGMKPDRGPLAAATTFTTQPPATPRKPHASSAYRPAGRPMVGVASWYQRGPHLRRTCSGEPLQNDRLTAASPNLPVGTRARVSLVHGNRAVVVKVNDCMPPGDHRIIDLSVAAARRLRIIRQGVAKVRVTPITRRPVQLSSR